MNPPGSEASTPTAGLRSADTAPTRFAVGGSLWRRALWRRRRTIAPVANGSVSSEVLTAEEPGLPQAVPAARWSDIADDLPAVSVQIEFLTGPPLLGRLQLVDAAVRILERQEGRHITLIDTLRANLKDRSERPPEGAIVEGL